MKQQNINNLVGTSGFVTDPAFEQVTDLLAEVGTVVKEEEDIGHAIGLVTTHYAVDDTVYELWYQVHTPKTPKSWECYFAFDKLII